MFVRGKPLRDAITAVVDTFGDASDDFVFVGGCVLGLYARSHGGALRATKDVDCISTVKPWIEQERRLAELCARGIVTPDTQLQCRYRIIGMDVDVDVLSPDGMNVGGVNPWFHQAAANARLYALDGRRSVRAISPPYFVATKLVAFADRGEDALSSKDAEDIVTAAVELPRLRDDIDAVQMAPALGELLRLAFAKHGVGRDDIVDFVEARLDRAEANALARIDALLRDLLDAT